MGRIRRVLLAAALSLSAVLTVGNASSAATGQIIQIAPMIHGNIVFFIFEGYGPGTPSCNTLGRFVVDTDTEHGKNVYALVLTARAAGWRLNPIAGPACDVWSDSATVDYIQIDNS